VPAVAVTPVPLAHIGVVAVKNLVAESLTGSIGWWSFKVYLVWVKLCNILAI